MSGKKGRYTRSLQTKVIVNYLVLVGLILLVSGYFTYYIVRDHFDEELGKSLTGIASASSRQIDGDVVPFLGTEFGQIELYQEIRKQLSDLRESFHVRSIYLFDNQNKNIFSTDSTVAVGKEYYHLKADALELVDVRSGIPRYSTLFRANDGKLYKSGFSPVYDKRGKLVAVIGVDASASFLNIVDRIAKSFLWLGIAGVLVSVIFSFILAKSIVVPIKELVKAVERITKGDLTTRVDPKQKDEIGFLSHSFNEMGESLQQKEELLNEMHRKAESRAAYIQTYNDLILENMVSGVLSVNERAKITVCNSEAEKILELTENEAIDRDCSDVIPDRANNLLDMLMQSLKGNVSNRRKKVIINDSQQQKLPLEVSTYSLKNETGKIVGATLVFTNLKEIKTLQDQIKVKERLAALGELSAGIAHEIRNPLSSMELYMDLLQRQFGSEPKQMELSEKISKEIVSLNKIVNEFLMFARTPRLYLEQVDIEDVIEDSLFFALSEHDSSKIIVTRSFLADGRLLSVDMNQIQQALLNLIINSLEAMPDGGQLNLETRLSSDAKFMEVIIADSGTGMEPAIRNNIFNPFFTTKNAGTGLGLPITHKIVEAHGGDIEFSCDEGKGTTFIVRLPIASNVG